MKIAFLLVFALMCNLVHAQQAQTILDASKFLPGPPEDTSVEYLNDLTQYDWGKTMRNTPTWQNASTDMYFQLSTYINAFSPLVGLQISKANTPNIYLVLDYIMSYGQNVIQQTNSSYGYVKRPYVRFSDNTLVPSIENQYSNISSYPSSFAFMGWLTALTLIEICPDKQNDILARGYNFGTSSIIAGVNWKPVFVSVADANPCEMTETFLVSSASVIIMSESANEARTILTRIFSIASRTGCCNSVCPAGGSTATFMVKSFTVYGLEMISLAIRFTS